MPRELFGFLPPAQKNVGLRNPAHGVSVSRIECDRFFQLVHRLIPFGLAAMDKPDEGERQRVVRLSLQGALKFCQGRLVVPMAIVMIQANRDMTFGKIWRER